MEIDEDGISALARGVRVGATNCGGSILVRGSFTALLPLQCSRCLCAYEARLEEEIAESIPIRSADDPEEGIEADDEYDVHILRGSRLDLGELIRQQILTAAPMIPLCSEDCEGLCESCGERIAACRCAGEEKPKGPQTEFGRILANALGNAEEKTVD